MIKFTGKNIITEERYEVENEAKNAALFTTGNGYMGIRGSFEEFGSLRVQGFYVRGFIDEIIEVIEPLPDNEYMKKYYFEEDNLKEFERQESCINLPDMLYVEIEVDGIRFGMLEGEIVSYKRELDFTTGLLRREVVWNNGRGDLTQIVFERFASYYDIHSYCQRVTLKPLNHVKVIHIKSGVDKRVKTAGQKIIRYTSERIDQGNIFLEFNSGKKYAFKAKMLVTSQFFAQNGSHDCKGESVGGKVYVACESSGEVSLEKQIRILTERDCSEEEFEAFFRNTHSTPRLSYGEHFEKHKAIISALMNEIDVEIEGDFQADAALRFANYHTLISASGDSVHSIAAKGLTGERYNQFVWWDCEIYQLPIFFHTLPHIARQCLIYRHKLLDSARAIAKEQGYCGAKYPFCSAVNGDERVWSYARHPFLQIHINADIAYAIINYYNIVGDAEFLLNYGIEMLIEIARYYVDRATYKDGKYHILNVTGPDEHHPYVDDNAYTNYLTKHIIETLLKYLGQYDCSKALEKTGLTEEEIGRMRDTAANMYLPLREDGLIPQFEGYFELNQGLEVKGNGIGKSFQMKQSGLYHKSQIIKQPDVLLLFSYVDVEVKNANYALNLDYYEKKCESSSSLSYAPHAICFADNKRMLSFYEHFMNTLRVDIDDLLNCAWQGVHSGALAGGWYCIFRGVAGIVCREDHISVNPNMIGWWKSVKFKFRYRGSQINVELKNKSVTLSLLSGPSVTVESRGTKHELDNKLIFSLEEQ